ncbi:hypothetical protein KAU45_04255 [bacterium]|nr:hypothetical protein [bacterium]
MLRRSISCTLLIAVGTTLAAVRLEEGEVFTWKGLTLFAPSDHWTVNEGEDVVALYRAEGEGYVAGNILLEAPDGLTGALDIGNREKALEELVRYLAVECRRRYGQVFDLDRYGGDGDEPAAALHFTVGERRVRAYAFLTRSGVYLLYLILDPEEEDRLATELERLVGGFSFR